MSPAGRCHSALSGQVKRPRRQLFVVKLQGRGHAHHQLWTLRYKVSYCPLLLLSIPTCKMLQIYHALDPPGLWWTRCLGRRARFNRSFSTVGAQSALRSYLTRTGWMHRQTRTSVRFRSECRTFLPNNPSSRTNFMTRVCLSGIRAESWFNRKNAME